MSNPWEWAQVPGGPKVYTSVTPEEAAVLGRLAAGRDVLEVGSAFGYSAIIMALAGARSVTAVDPHLPHADNGMTAGSHEVMLGNLTAAGVDGTVTVIREASQDALPVLAAQGKRFGLVFIDADHAYDSVVHDAGWARKLATPGGHIACHDYGHGTPGSAPDGIESVNQALDEIFPLGPDELTGTLHVTRAQAGDLLVIVPSRGRPGNTGRLLEAVHATARLTTHVHVAVDEDDPEVAAYRTVMAEAGADGDVLEVGPRNGLCGWTNEVAVRRAAEYPFLASLGDDMVPRTRGWDRALVRAITDMGGTGLAYPWDGTREDIPEAVVLSSDIVQALRWMALPDLSHWWIDNVWADLGRGADCLRYLRAVAVDHVHPGAGLAPPDRTYAESGTKIAADRGAYYRWRAERMATDVAVVAGLRERRLQPA